MTEQAIFGGAATGAPWYVVLVIVAFPGLFAVLLTMAAVIMLRRVNRESGNPPLPALTVVKWTLGIGATMGPMCQWGFQRLASHLTGVPMHYELIVVAVAVTGLASMIAYEMLRWQSKKRWPGLYALISVKHDPARGHGGNSPDGDLTVMEKEPR